MKKLVCLLVVLFVYVPAFAVDVQMGIVKRSELVSACAERDSWIALGVNDPGDFDNNGNYIEDSGDPMPASSRRAASRHFAMCEAVVDLNALVGGEPTNAQIINAINTVVAARDTWEQKGGDFPNPPGFFFSKASLPGDASDTASCGTTADTVCSLIQETETARGAYVTPPNFCRISCLLDESGGKLWGIFDF